MRDIDYVEEVIDSLIVGGADQLQVIISKKYEDLINYLSHKVHPESLSLSRWFQWLVGCVNR